MKNRISEYRKAKGITQAELGIILGVNGSAVSQMEAGITDVPVSKINKLIQTFECDPCDLFPELAKYSRMHSGDAIKLFVLWQGLEEKTKKAMLLVLKLLNGH